MSCKKKENNPCKTCDNGCDPLVQGECVVYSGPETEFLHIPPGLDLDDIILGFDSILNSIQNTVDGNDDQILIWNANTGELTITGGNSVFLPFIGNNMGSITLSGDGVATSFTFPHNYPIPPQNLVVCANSTDAAGFAYAEISGSNIIVYYNVAPEEGSANIKLSWSLK